MLKPFWKDKNRFWVTFNKEDAKSLLEGEKVYPCYFPTNRSIKALIKNTKIAWNVLHKPFELLVQVILFGEIFYLLLLLVRQEEKLSAEKAEIVKQRVALYEQYADGNMSKEEFIRQRDAYRAQEDEKMEQIQRFRTEKNQIFLPVRKDADNLQTVVSAAEESSILQID